MKRTLLNILFLSMIVNLTAQNTWYKTLPGIKALNSFVDSNTIVTFCEDFQGGINMPIAGMKINKSKLSNGNLLKVDSHYYYNSRNNINSDLVYLNKYNSIQTGKGQYLYGTMDRLRGDNFVATSQFHVYPEFTKQNIDLNYPSNYNYSSGLFNISGRKYAIMAWYRNVNKSCFVNNRIEQIYDDGSSRFVYTKPSPYEDRDKTRQIDQIIGDNQDNSFLLLNSLEYWGSPCANNDGWENVITKIDTLGNVIWECKPSGLDQDTANTSYFQMVQLPSGNIVCAWIDAYYRPRRNPKRDNITTTDNPGATIWMAEIDGNTGRRLWVKNIKQYINWKFISNDHSNTFNVYLYHAQVVDGNSIVWLCSGIKNQEYKGISKMWPILIKTDFSGNPIWYRDFNFFPKDTFERGFFPESFITTPDKGILVSGQQQILERYSDSFSFIRKSAMFKLDNNGCFSLGCNITDRVVDIKVETKLCAVYPSPASNQITISYPKDFVENWEIKMFDNTGKAVFKSSQNLTQIPCSQFPCGIYFIQITNKQRQVLETHQIVVQH